jgi:FtsZ-interacting cell division protein ZipA
MIAAPVAIHMQSLRDITFVAAGIALAVLVVEVGLWLGARRAERAVVQAARREEAGRAAEHRMTE